MTNRSDKDEYQTYFFRGLHSSLRMGTASDRYAGWIGQIYPEHYRSKIKKRSRKLGGKSFTEETLPIACVADYFKHYDVLELDFTFYRPLLDDEGNPTSSYHVLREYVEAAPPDALFFLKAPQLFFSRRIRRRVDGRQKYIRNESYLDYKKYVEQFHTPAGGLLGEQLRGIIFEQEYQRVGDSPSSAENIAQLESFFDSIPGDVQPHIEMRSPHLLTKEYFDWLEDAGIGHVFSHWTWLPPLRKQWKMSGERFTARNDDCVVRLLTPLEVPYAKAYAETFPFDAPVEKLSESTEGKKMVDDTVALLYQAEKQNALLQVFTNNRAWGNAPELGRALGERIRREEVKRRDSDE